MRYFGSKLLMQSNKEFIESLVWIILLLKTLRLFESCIDKSNLIHSITEDEIKVFLKKLCLNYV